MFRFNWAPTGGNLVVVIYENGAVAVRVSIDTMWHTAAHFSLFRRICERCGRENYIHGTIHPHTLCAFIALSPLVRALSTSLSQCILTDLCF